MSAAGVVVAGGLVVENLVLAGGLVAGRLRTAPARRKPPEPKLVPLRQLLASIDKTAPPISRPAADRPAQARSTRNPHLAALAAERPRDPVTGQFLKAGAHGREAQ